MLNIQDATLRIGLLYHVRLLNTDDSHINNYSSKPSMFMKHLLEKELKKYLKSTNNIEDSSDKQNTIKRCDIITVRYKDFPNFFSSSCLELDNFDTLLREEHIGLSEAADIMTCLCPICLPLKTPLSTKLDNFCFNSWVRNENGGHTFSRTSAEKEEDNNLQEKRREENLSPLSELWYLSVLLVFFNFFLLFLF